jgi:prophage DNA circulation protein
MEKRLSGKSPRDIARRQLSPARPTAQAVVRAVAEVHGIKPVAALQRKSGAAFKQALYLLRRRANLSLREVAEMAGVTIGRVAQIQSELESQAPDRMLERVVSKL